MTTEYRVDEMGKLLFRTDQAWKEEELANRISNFLCIKGHRFEVFQKDNGSWVLDESNDWWFSAEPDNWYAITYRYYGDDNREKFEALGAALVWLV